MVEQSRRLALTSRAFYNDALGPFERHITELFGFDKVLPMNAGAEGVETALKLARRWGYRVKGIPDNEAKVVVCDGNFHGRTITVISASSDPDSYAGFGPYTPGFVKVPYDDLPALEGALADPTVCAFLVEPIQGEAGVVIPPNGYLAELARISRDHDVLFMADEIQSGLGRTGATFACDHEKVQPDLYILGKALGGGIVPLSAVVGDWSVLDVLGPRSHGSTFGGNPLAAAVGLEVIDLLNSGVHQDRAAAAEARFRDDLAAMFGDRGCR